MEAEGTRGEPSPEGGDLFGGILYTLDEEQLARVCYSVGDHAVNLGDLLAEIERLREKKEQIG